MKCDIKGCESEAVPNACPGDFATHRDGGIHLAPNSFFRKEVVGKAYACAYHAGIIRSEWDALPGRENVADAAAPIPDDDPSPVDLAALTRSDNSDPGPAADEEEPSGAFESGGGDFGGGGSSGDFSGSSSSESSDSESSDSSSSDSGGDS